MISGKQIAAVLLVFSLIALPLCTTAGAEEIYEPDEITSGLIAADVFVARPLGLASTILGAATFIVSSPFCALGGNIDYSFNQLVKKPFFYTFQRPCGVF